MRCFLLLGAAASAWASAAALLGMLACAARTGFEIDDITQIAPKGLQAEVMSGDLSFFNKNPKQVNEFLEEKVPKQMQAAFLDLFLCLMRTQGISTSAFPSDSGYRTFIAEQWKDATGHGAGGAGDANVTREKELYDTIRGIGSQYDFLNGFKDELTIEELEEFVEKADASSNVTCKDSQAFLKVHSCAVVSQAFLCGTNDTDHRCPVTCGACPAGGGVNEKLIFDKIERMDPVDFEKELKRLKANGNTDFVKGLGKTRITKEQATEAMKDVNFTALLGENGINLAELGSLVQGLSIGDFTDLAGKVHEIPVELLRLLDSDTLKGIINKVDADQFADLWEIVSKIEGVDTVLIAGLDAGVLDLTKLDLSGVDAKTIIELAEKAITAAPSAWTDDDVKQFGKHAGQVLLAEFDAIQAALVPAKITEIVAAGLEILQGGGDFGLDNLTKIANKFFDGRGMANWNKDDLAKVGPAIMGMDLTSIPDDMLKEVVKSNHGLRWPNLKSTDFEDKIFKPSVLGPVSTWTENTVYEVKHLLPALSAEALQALPAGVVRRSAMLETLAKLSHELTKEQRTTLAEKAGDPKDLTPVMCETMGGLMAGFRNLRELSPAAVKKISPEAIIGMNAASLQSLGANLRNLSSDARAQVTGAVLKGLDKKLKKDVLGCGEECPAALVHCLVKMRKGLTDADKEQLEALVLKAAKKTLNPTDFKGGKAVVGVRDTGFVVVPAGGRRLSGAGSRRRLLEATSDSVVVTIELSNALSGDVTTNNIMAALSGAVIGSQVVGDSEVVYIDLDVDGAATPPNCDTVADHASFCIDNGNNGLLTSALTTRCMEVPCTKAADGAQCCKPAPANCTTITEPNVAAFCKDNGANGLVEDAVCQEPICLKENDAKVCCALVVPSAALRGAPVILTVALVMGAAVF